jgi:G3E family GTPase
MTYDCSRPSLFSDDFEDAVAQLAAAGTIVLTKVDLVSSERRNEAFAAVTATNPLAKVVNEFSASIRAREAFLQPGGGPSLAVNEQSRQPGRRQLLHPRVRVFRAKLDENVPWETALDWLENLAGALGERLLRIKAIVPGDNRSNRVLLQSVGTTFSAPRRLNPNSSSPLGAVIIARDCGRQDLEEIPTEHPVTWFDH